MFALGLLSWMYDRPDRGHERVPARPSSPEAARSSTANVAAFEAGWTFGETTEAFAVHLRDRAGPDAGRAPTATSPATSRWPTAWSPRRERAGLPLFLGSYPITPASDILHELTQAQALRRHDLPGRGRDRRHRRGARARRSAARWASPPPPGPGIALKSETIGLAVSLELPLVIVDVQRGGPSTGLPTKTEQADLLQAMFGRNGEAPVPIVAPRSPGDCFDAALEAVRIAVDLPHAGVPALRRLPRQRLRAVADPRRRPTCRTSTPDFATEPNHTDADGSPEFWPYLRDPETLARPWAIPGTPGLEHRIGGLEKADGTGDISYDPDNHDTMVRLRQAKIDGIADAIPDLRGRRPGRRRPGARARLGLDLRADRRGLPPRRASRHAGRPGAPAPPQPVPGQPRRGPAPLRQGARARR